MRFLSGGLGFGPCLTIQLGQLLDNPAGNEHGDRHGGTAAHPVFGHFFVAQTLGVLFGRDSVPEGFG